MAFVDYQLNNPGYAGERDVEEIFTSPVQPGDVALDAILPRLFEGSLDVLLSPAYNPDGIIPNGWQVIGSGGGGGGECPPCPECPECHECPECPPTGRPSTGVLYPRGQG